MSVRYTESRPACSPGNLVASALGTEIARICRPERAKIVKSSAIHRAFFLPASGDFGEGFASLEALEGTATFMTFSAKGLHACGNRQIALVFAAGVTLSACGGSGDSGGGTAGVVVTSPAGSPGSSPSPAPSPSSTPPPPQTAAAIPPSNLTASQTFVALGYSLSYEYNGLNVVRSRPVDLNEPLVVRYNSVTRSYETELPGFAPGRLILNNSTGGRGYSLTNGFASDALQRVVVNFFSGQVTQSHILTYSNFASWEGKSELFSNMEAMGHFAFGIPTAVEGVPAVGTRTYAFRGGGLTEVYDASTSPDFRLLSAEGSLQLNFAQRTFTGSIRITSDIEQDFALALSGVAIQPDGSFVGTISVPGLAEAGSIQGRFMGPAAEEVIVRWRTPLPIASGGKAGQAFGVWVGKAS